VTSGSADTDILIAGGGIAGATLALLLAEKGFSVLLAEPRPPDSAAVVDDVGQRVVALNQASRQVLAMASGWPAPDAAGPTAYRTMQIEDERGTGRLTFEAFEHGVEALGWIVDHRQLHGVLWQRLRAGRVRLLAGRAVVAVDDNGADGEIASARLDDGTLLKTRLLIAADGARSALRQGLGIPLAATAYGQKALVAVIMTREPNSGIAWQRFLSGGPLALLPVTRGRSSIVWSLPDERAAAMIAAGDDEFHRALNTASREVFGPVEASGPRAAFALDMQLARRYVAGRVVLLGDAAHRTHPLAGQGLNLGLADCAALLAVLGTEQRPLAAPRSWLRRWERARRSEDEIMIRATDLINRTMSPALGPFSAPRSWLAGFGLAAVDRLWPLKDWLFRRAAGLTPPAAPLLRQP